MNMYSCPTCNTSLNSQSQWEAHISGVKHKKKLKENDVFSRLSSCQDSSSGAIHHSTGSKNNNSLSSSYLSQDGSYKCKVCPGFVCTGIIPMEAHLAGVKHRKALQMQSSCNKNVTCPTSQNPSTGTFLNAQLQSIATEFDDNDQYLLGADGIYRCKVCPGFFVNGIVPMKDHLRGQKHQKALIRQGVSSGNLFAETLRSFAQAPLSTSSNGQLASITPYEPPAVQLGKAWKHDISCGFDYHTIEMLEDLAKIRALSPHFAFVSKGDPIPDLSSYLRP